MQTNFIWNPPETATARSEGHVMVIDISDDSEDEFDHMQDILNVVALCI